LSGSAFASLRQWVLSGAVRHQEGPPVKPFGRPQRRTFPPRIFAHGQQTSNTAGKQGPNQDQTSLLKSRVSRPGALIGCHPQQSCPRRAHPETPPSALLSLGCADVQMPTMCPSQLLGAPFPWPILRLAREPTSHHAQTSRQKGYIEVVGGAGICDLDYHPLNGAPPLKALVAPFVITMSPCTADREVTFARYPMH
jgi:hypothetical protein